MTTEQLAGLEEHRDVLLKSLRDLENERATGEIGDADYSVLKDDYTARTAAVLRAIEAGRSAARGPVGRARAAAPTDRDRGARRQRSLAITLGVAFAVVALAGGSVVYFAGGRDPGAPVTGSVPGASSDRVAEALSMETQGRAVEALKLYDDAIREDPANVEALAYKGWLLKRAGLADKALESLDRAVAVDPTFPDAHFFRGMVLYQDKDDPAGAVAEFKAFLANDPPPDFVASVEEVLALAEQAVAAKAGGAPAPAAPDPAAAPAP